MKPPSITSNLPVVLCTFTMMLEFTIHICSYSTWGLDHNCTLKLRTGRKFFDLGNQVSSLDFSISLYLKYGFIFHNSFFSSQRSAVLMTLLPYVFNEPTKSEYFTQVHQVDKDTLNTCYHKKCLRQTNFKEVCLIFPNLWWFSYSQGTKKTWSELTPLKR